MRLRTACARAVAHAHRGRGHQWGGIDVRQSAYACRSLPETFKPGHNWDKYVPPLLPIDAVQTAADAVRMQPRRWLIKADWHEREATYHDVNEARERLRYGEPPKHYFVSVASPDYGAGRLIDVTLSGDSFSGSRSRASVEGTDYARCRHALDAVRHVVDTRVSSSDASRPSGAGGAERALGAPPAPVRDQRDAGLLRWMNKNQGLLAAIGAALTAIDIVVAILLG